MQILTNEKVFSHFSNEFEFFQKPYPFFIKSYKKTMIQNKLTSNFEYLSPKEYCRKNNKKSCFLEAF